MDYIESKLKCIEILYKNNKQLSAKQAVEEAKVLSEYVTDHNHVKPDNTLHKG